MILSGTAAVAIGFAFDGPAWLLALFGILLGVTVIADGAPFSAAVTELADSAFVGTARQLGLGYALTVVAIWLVPVIAALAGSWQWAFLVLVPGPIVGTLAMLRLRSLPQAANLANGAR